MIYLHHSTLMVAAYGISVLPLLQPVVSAVGLTGAATHWQVQKKKIWEELQPMLLTDDSRVAGFNGVPMLTSAGPVTAGTLTAAHIS